MNNQSSRTTVMGRIGLRGVMLALCLATVGTLPMVAQDGGSGQSAPQQGEAGQPGGRPTANQMVDRQIEHLTTALTLTPDQVSQVRPILTTEATQMMALRQNTETAGPDKRDQMMQIRNTTQTKIRALLTSDQQTRYDALLAQQQQRRGRRGFGGQGNPGSSTPPPQ
jgi:periplasmic protein CpxP/Spy